MQKKKIYIKITRGIFQNVSHLPIDVESGRLTGQITARDNLLTHLILPEDRTCILKLSLEKLRFLEDPEIYLRRSVLINNLLRKIHLEVDKENYEYYKEAPSCKTAYTDARKRLKLMVKGCCSQSLYCEELHSYRIVPYDAENVLYGMNYTSSHLAQNSQLLICRMKE